MLPRRPDLLKRHDGANGGMIAYRSKACASLVIAGAMM
jgi:hypothetical protein